MIVRRLPLALGLLLILGSQGCGPAVTVRRLAPAPYNLGPVRDLVLAAADGPTERETGLVRVRLLERIDEQGVFKIEDAAPRSPDIFEFFERLFSKEKTSRTKDAEEFRRRHPAEVYVRLRVSELRSFKREERKKRKDKDDELRYWAEAECGFQLTLIDGRDGTRLARFTTSQKATSPIYDSWREDLRYTAEKEAVNRAVDDALAQFTPRRVSDRLTLDDKAPRAAEGIELIKNDRLKEARSLWEKAVKESGGSAGLSYNLGCISEAVGDTKAASEWYEDAVRLDPSERNRKAADALKRRMADAERLRNGDR